MNGARPVSSRSENTDVDFLVEVPLAHADPRFERLVNAAIARRNRNLRGTASPTTMSLATG